MSIYTHWACFDCRKSFHDLPLPSKGDTGSKGARKCRDCGNVMTDMGVYFEPPRRTAKRAWEISRLLSENGYSFQTEGNVAFIKSCILGARNTGIERVRNRIAQIKQAEVQARNETRLKKLKRAKRARLNQAGV